MDKVCYECLFEFSSGKRFIFAMRAESKQEACIKSLKMILSRKLYFLFKGEDFDSIRITAVKAFKNEEAKSCIIAYDDLQGD